jgi:hypothetical protein
MFLFISSAFLSYIALRKKKYRLIETLADIAFFTGMFIMLIVGIIIVYTSY